MSYKNRDTINIKSTFNLYLLEDLILTLKITDSMGNHITNDSFIFSQIQCINAKIDGDEITVFANSEDFTILIPIENPLDIKYHISIYNSDISIDHDIDIDPIIPDYCFVESLDIDATPLLSDTMISTQYNNKHELSFKLSSKPYTAKQFLVEVVGNNFLHDYIIVSDMVDCSVKILGGNRILISTTEQILSFKIAFSNIRNVLNETLIMKVVDVNKKFIPLSTVTFDIGKSYTSVSPISFDMISLNKSDYDCRDYFELTVHLTNDNDAQSSFMISFKGSVGSNYTELEHMGTEQKFGQYAIKKIGIDSYLVTVMPHTVTVVGYFAIQGVHADVDVVCYVGDVLTLETDRLNIPFKLKACTTSKARRVDGSN